MKLIDAEAYTSSWLIIRLLMSSMFVESGIDKLLHWNEYLAETLIKGIPLPGLSLPLVIATEIIGSATLVSGIYIRPGAMILVGYVFTLNIVYFDFWHQDGMDAVMARKEFLKNFAVVAGLLLIALVARDSKSR
ncbi:DoxX family protein [Methylomonas sp. AM2-LC]|uniref:DoxX family protein n=1 Tax=Methylomonas sp. AM2-LC TaxID=3153301 RepID=UPI003267AA67